MQNNVEELYSLLRFLCLRPLDDWNEFKVKIAQPIKNGRPQRAIKRLHVRRGYYSIVVQNMADMSFRRSS